MRSNARWVVVLAAIVVMYLNGARRVEAASSRESDEATAMMSGYEAEERAAAAARSKDAAWKPSCKEVNVIQVTDGGNPAALKKFCLNKDGNILACFAGTAKSSDPKKASGIRV